MNGYADLRTADATSAMFWGPTGPRFRVPEESSLIHDPNGDPDSLAWQLSIGFLKCGLGRARVREEPCPRVSPETCEQHSAMNQE